MKSLFLLFLVNTAMAMQTQTYRVTFESNWNRAEHAGLPGNAHFSPIVAIAHNEKYELLPLGGISNRALERVAEIGNVADINTELDAEKAMGSVGQVINTENQFVLRTPSQTFEIEVSSSHPFFSFVTMIAPSPDWIVGVSNLKLFDEATGFKRGVQNMPLLAIDAGTESGDRAGNFSIRNAPTSPKTPINFLIGQGFQAPFAFVTVEPVAE